MTAMFYDENGQPINFVKLTARLTEVEKRLDRLEKAHTERLVSTGMPHKRVSKNPGDRE